MMKKNLLITLADENYVEQAKQLFSSVYWNAGWKGDYMLLAHEIPEKKLRWFRDKGILVRKCKSILRINKPKKHPLVILCKLYLFIPEFKKWKNIIFLDADIIVRASLADLTKINGFAAVLDTPIPKIINQLTDIKSNENLINELKKDYDLEKEAFNAGVMAFNTEIIEKDSFSRMLKISKRIKNINKLFVEQMILNFYFYKKWIKLPIVYNLYPHLIIKPNENKNLDSIILHFTDYEPWIIKNPFYKEWKNNLEKYELIDLRKIPNGKKWSRRKIKKKSNYYGRVIFIWPSIKNIRDINRLIGAIGISLKKHFPNLYYKLKKLK